MTYRPAIRCPKRRPSRARPALRCAASATLLILAQVPALTAQTRPTQPAAKRAATVRTTSALRSAIDSTARALVKEGRIAGLSIAVLRGRDTLALAGYGSADLELNVPTPARAIYEIGSVTKQFTAAAILMLRDEGKLSLDADITTYLPDYPTQGHRVTVRRLLDHTSGIKGYTEIEAFEAMMPRDLPKDSLVALFSKAPFDFAPGEAEIYNNSAFFLLGLIIEKTSGMTYADFVQKRLFDKVGMPDSRYCSESAITPRKAHGYDMSSKGLVHKGFIVHTYPYSAGSLCSSAADLLTWLVALHGDRVLPAASYREMTRPATLSDGTTLRYGMGLALHTLGGHPAIEHGGGIPGFLSSTAYFPAHGSQPDMYVVVLLNTAGPVSAESVTSQIAELVLGPAVRVALPSPTSASTLVGTYAGTGRGEVRTVSITWENGTLNAAVGKRPARALRYIGNDTWEMDDTRLTFTTASGATHTLRYDTAYGYSILSRTP